MTARKRIPWLVGAAVALAAGLWWGLAARDAKPDVPLLDVATNASEAREAHEALEAGICPWRDPKSDLKRFFPAATGYSDQIYALTRYRQEMARRLGRAPTGDDNILRAHRVLQGTHPLGTILTRRIRGESGVIELVMAVDRQGTVLGARLQRLREPDEVAQQLCSAAWLGAFQGKTAHSDWQSGKDFPPLSASAQTSAAAILDGARSASILLEIGNTAAPATGHAHP